MMMQLSEFKDNDGDGEDCNHGQLLRDIEEISKALYLHTTSDVRSKSAGKTRFSDSKLKSNSNPRLAREDLLHKDKKSSSIWNWKKPLKALTHFGNRKFSCCFYLHVHSVEGLPENFNNLCLSVKWKRKDQVVQTRSSRVVDGVAEFDETLMHRCSVFGSRNGANHSVKYEEKLFLIYVSLSGAPRLDIGKHLVDITRLLPLTFEELEGEKSYGKWTTSFNLSGKAKGANLNVSLGFLVTQDKSVNVSVNPNVPELMNTAPRRSTSLDGGATMLRRVGSVPTSVNPRPAFSSQSLDLKFCSELLSGGLELSKSINFLCQALDEDRLSSAMEADSEHVQPLKPKPNLDLLSIEEIEEYEDDDTEFNIIEVGTEITEKDQLKSDQVTGHADDESTVEIINVDEIINDYDIDLGEKTVVCPKDVSGDYVDEVVPDARKHEEDGVYTKGSTMEEMESASRMQSISEPAELDHAFCPDEIFEERNHMELKSIYKANKTGKISLSLDDVAESVSSDFLNILGMDCSMSSDSDAESPRERLLREFEKEASASGNLFFDFDWKDEQLENGSCVSPGSECDNCFENSDLSLIIQAAEEEQKRESELLKRRKAKILEGLETEALMRAWGLKEKDFQKSPLACSGGFGSPIELPLEEPLLPPLEEGFGPCVQMKGGGFLRSMNPSLFRNAKNGANLVIQISNPVVIPAEMGYDVIEIMQHLALVGIGNLHAWVNELMPLEDITGKTIQQAAWEAAAPNVVSSERFEQILYGNRQDEGFPSSWNCNNLRSELGGSEMGSDYVSLDYLAPLAMEKIEALSVEGLRIQSHMSNGEAPLSIDPQSGWKVSAFKSKSANCGEILKSEGVGGLQVCNFDDHDDDSDGLIALSLPLEEWLRLDAKIIGDEYHSREQLSKILAAHHAKCTDLGGGSLPQDMNCSDLSSGKCGILGNNLTIALMVQLRDPFRNYEPVGIPMLALIQVERALTHLIPKVPGVMFKDSIEKEHDDLVFEEIGDEKNEETTEGEGGNPQFKIIVVHLAGVDTAPVNTQLWGTTTQLQSGSRWLLGSAMGKTSSFPPSNSNAIVRSSRRVSAKQRRDILWSISSHSQGTGAAWKDLIAQHIRNPNVIFPIETIKPHENMS